MSTIRKTTEGHVNQIFDSETGKLISQEFVCGDQCEYENLDGSLDEHREILYHPYQMVVPGMTVMMVGSLHEGYEPVGPFEDFKAACKWANGAPGLILSVTTWAMTMTAPQDYEGKK